MHQYCVIDIFLYFNLTLYRISFRLEILKFNVACQSISPEHNFSIHIPCDHVLSFQEGLHSYYRSTFSLFFPFGETLVDTEQDKLTGEGNFLNEISNRLPLL